MTGQGKTRKSKKDPRNAQPVQQAVCAAGPSLCEFWEELRRAMASGSPLPAVPSAAASDTAATSGAPAPVCRAASSGRSSGSFGSSSGSGGYGLGLILPDAKAQKRVMDIMRALCEKDAQRARDARGAEQLKK